MAEAGQSHEAEGPWLTLSEAAARSGRHIDALRAMARRGKLERRKGNAGQWLVRLPESLPQDDSGAAHADDSGLAEVAAELREEVAELRVALARAETQAEAAKAVAAVEVEAIRRQTTAELEAKDTVVTELRARADRLETALAEARRPWLAKVIEGLRRKG
jgi:hypothetical protein